MGFFFLHFGTVWAESSGGDADLLHVKQPAFVNQPWRILNECYFLFHHMLQSAMCERTSPSQVTSPLTERGHLTDRDSDNDAAERWQKS